MWQKSPHYPSRSEEALSLKRAPSLRRRFILAGGIAITIIAVVAIQLVFNFSQKLADLSYDRLLRSALLQMNENVLSIRGQVSIDIPWSAFATLAQANDDRVFYRVDSSEYGFITGYEALKSAPMAPSELGVIQFYNQIYSGELVRFAWIERDLTEPDAVGTVRLLLGQTRLSREDMASAITTRAVQIILLIALVAMALIIIGSHLVLRPLHRIEQLLEDRQPGDLTPITIDTPKETHQLKVAINHFMARLRSNLEQLENYTAESAHQLRTPLASLKALAENARDNTTPMGQQMALEQIVEQSDKLSQTVTMLLNQAVVSHRLQTQSLHALDLVALTRQTCMEMAVPALRQGIHLALDAKSNTLMILGDAFSLQQMLMNLIDNAVRYSSETDAIGKEVNIRLSQHEASVLLSVIDYGKGIADAEKHKVFERFYRGNYQVSGSGVGLTMVKEIVERHRARVRVLDSEPHGATIEIAFPLLILKEES